MHAPGSARAEPPTSMLRRERLAALLARTHPDRPPAALELSRPRALSRAEMLPAMHHERAPATLTITSANRHAESARQAELVRRLHPRLAPPRHVTLPCVHRHPASLPPPALQ